MASKQFPISNSEQSTTILTKALTVIHVRRQFQHLAIGAGFLLSLSTLPAVADVPDLSGILNSIRLPNPFEQILGDWRERIPTIGNILEEAIGRIGCDVFACSIEEEDLPNPYEVRATLPHRQQLDPQGDVLSINTTVRARDLSNLYDQELSRASAAPFLGSKGVEWASQQNQQTRSVMESNQSAGQQVQQLAISAQQQDITQSVMKISTRMQSQLAGMLINQGQLNGQIASSLVGLQQGQAALVQLAANHSEAVDEINRRERVNRNTLLYQASGTQVYIPGLY